MATFLVVDDEPDMRASLRFFLSAKGHRLLEAANGTEALAILEKNHLDGVLLDLFLAKENGMSLLGRIKKVDSSLPVVVVTGHADVPTAVEAMKLGAADYIAKPFNNEHLLVILEKAAKLRELSMEVETLRRQVQKKTCPAGVIFGPSPAIQDALKQVYIVSPTDLSVIIQGPSGCGKEVIARLTHKFSHRKNGPFLAVDCGTLPEALVESELFGFEKGAFTGADRKKPGQFEMAYKGTLFLDEVGNLSLVVQAKLLRVLQEKKIHHLGGKKDIPVDVRILAASNKDLLEAVRKGEFREDLYHRLNQFFIKLPPLKKRIEDIPVLAAQFLKESTRVLHKRVQSVSQAALDMLQAHSWPGNVRELKNVILRAALLSDKVIGPEHLQIETLLCHDESPFNQTLKSAVMPIEKELIQKALKQTKGNKVQAARLLGIDRKALYYKMAKYELV